MKKTIIVLIILIIIGVGVYYYTFSNNGSPAYAPQAAINPVTTTVSINNFAFAPQNLTVKKGTKVTWTNNDSVPHTVTSDMGTLLNSQTLSPGQSWIFTFSDVGTFNYHCNIHKMMKGSIVVEN